jgi:hypothetical protein
MKFYLLIMGVGFLLQCAAAPRSSGAASGAVEVELDIFSGAPTRRGRFRRKRRANSSAC